jgi:hypothetical protein
VHDSYKVLPRRRLCLCMGVKYVLFLQGPNVSDEVLLTCCGMCGKQNAPKICTGCKKARYCDGTYLI